MLNHSPALDLVFHALADPTRRRIVDRLARGPSPVSALAARRATWERRLDRFGEYLAGAPPHPTG